MYTVDFGENFIPQVKEGKTPQFYYIFEDEKDPNFRKELCVWHDGTLSIDNMEVPSQSFHAALQSLLKRSK